MRTVSIAAIGNRRSRASSVGETPARASAPMRAAESRACRRSFSEAGFREKGMYPGAGHAHRACVGRNTRLPPLRPMHRHMRRH